MVIKDADNITKNLATGMSIVLSVLASMAFFNFDITPTVRVVSAAIDSHN